MQVVCLSNGAKRLRNCLIAHEIWHLIHFPSAGVLEENLSCMRFL